MSALRIALHILGMVKLPPESAQMCMHTRAPTCTYTHT